MDENEKAPKILIRFEAGSNNTIIKDCTFNGDVYTSELRKKEASPKEASPQPSPKGEGEENPLIDELLPIFFNVREEAEAFVRAIDGQKPTSVTEKVNDLLRKEKISRAGSKSVMWNILHKYGLYNPGISTWNRQVN